MMSLFGKAILFFVILISSAYADVTPPSTNISLSTKLAATTDKVDLINYLSDVLINAGFSESTRTFLINSARENLSKVTSVDQKEKLRLLKRNLYIFLNDVAEKNETAASSEIIHKQYFIAEQYPQPWDYILTKDVLNSFKSHHVFDRLTVADIHDSNSKFCPVWPFCSDN